MVRIRKRSAEGGHIYEVEDFDDYVRTLQEHGVDPPLGKFRLFVSLENEELISRSIGDWESQVALLFKLSPALGISYEVVSE
jgi:hypothetical protein